VKEKARALMLISRLTRLVTGASLACYHRASRRCARSWRSSPYVNWPRLLTLPNRKKRLSTIAGLAAGGLSKS